MPPKRFSILFLVLVVLMLASSRTQAQERLCDPAFEDCRAPLWALIDAENVGIDVAFWFMQDSSYATKIINRFKAVSPFASSLIRAQIQPTTVTKRSLIS